MFPETLTLPVETLPNTLKLAPSVVIPELPVNLPPVVANTTLVLAIPLSIMLPLTLMLPALTVPPTVMLVPSVVKLALPNN